MDGAGLNKSGRRSMVFIRTSFETDQWTLCCWYSLSRNHLPVSSCDCCLYSCKHFYEKTALLILFSGLKRYKVVSISQHLFAIFLVLLTQCIRTHFSVVPSGHNRHHIEIYWYTLRTNKSGFLPVFGSSQAVFLFGLVGIVFSFKSWLRVNYDVMVVMIWRLKHCVNTRYINGSCCQPQFTLSAFKTQTHCSVLIHWASM